MSRMIKFVTVAVLLTVVGGLSAAAQLPADRSPELRPRDYLLAQREIAPGSETPSVAGPGATAARELAGGL
jgi:hypothetical protein